MFDPLAFKKKFPLFSSIENQQLIYLDNAATTQKPLAVIDGISQYYTHYNANANRSGHRLGREVTATLEKVREKTAAFIGAKSVDEIIFTHGATEGINIVANGLANTLSLGDEIVITTVEHHANIVPWQELANKTGATLRWLVNIGSEIENVINDKTKIIAVAGASNTLGRITDLSFIKKIKQRYPHIIVLVDGAQLIAHQPVDVVSTGCDFFVFSSHKMYGPTGLGVLYGKKDQLYALSPLLFGGEMITRVYDEKSEYAMTPARFEAGTAPLAAIAGFQACLDFWATINRREMMDYEKELTHYLHQQLQHICDDFPDLTLLTKAQDNVGIAALSSKQYSVYDLATWLDKQDIAVRVGELCAQPLWRHLSINGVLRISLAAYNTHRDIDLLIHAIQDFMLVLKQSEHITSQSNIDINRLLAFRTWQQRYKAIIALGKNYQPSENIRLDENQVSGCETPLWLKRLERSGSSHFIIDSDSAVIKGLALLILHHAKTRGAEERMDDDFSEYYAMLGFDKYLSQSRLNGLGALVKKIRSVQSD